MPRISIVITCYNYERYVAMAIGSALEQTVPPLEIIVVNDGSTDGSAAMLASFGDRIAVITQENRGQIAAANRGYAACRGDIVLFLDADDLLLPGALAAVVDVWTPACAKVQFELDVINGAGEFLGRRFCNYVAPYGSDEIRREFNRFGTYVWPVLTGNAYSRWFLARVMPLTVAMGPDGFLNTIAPLYGDIAVVPEALGRYRLHDANQSYHGSASNALGVRFAKQVSLRASELRLLVDHAAARSVALPPGHLLDHDLPFVNYRLMLKKLGQDYEGADGDSSWRLWRAGIVLLTRRPLPTRLKAGHAAWLSVLLCSPGPLARRLIALRFNRAALLQPLRRRLTRLLGWWPGPSGRAA
ncbi:MAG: glycosyltransferase family 2 protein [Burkholderiales bacterium]